MWVKTGKSRSEQMLSALPPLATGERTFWIGSFVPLPDQVHCGKKTHSTTSSARTSSVCGISMPSDLAVLVLITKSYLVGACTGYFEISNHRIPCIAPSIRRVAAAAFSFATLVYPIMSPL
jgi:hypothetical protein